jgi:hypothetical protein
VSESSPTVDAEVAGVARAEAQLEKRREAEAAKAAHDRQMQLAELLTAELPREGMSELCFAAARKIAVDVLTGHVQIRNGTDAAAAMRALMETGRLEGGEPTGFVEHATPQDRIDNIKRLQTEAQKRRREAERARPPAVASA